MNKRKSTSVVEPRKEPKQERSRQTYQVILQGATRVIRRDGLSKLSTNKVAEESGVSIGSLYQYFPSKQAIIAALIDQIFTIEFQRLESAFQEMSPKLGARQIIKKIFGFYYQGSDEDLAYRRALVDSVAVVDKNAEALKFHRAVGELFITYFTEHFPGSGVTEEPKTLTFMIQYMMKAVAQSSVDQQLSEINRELLIVELAETLMNFLRVPAEYREVLS